MIGNWRLVYSGCDLEFGSHLTGFGLVGPPVIDDSGLATEDEPVRGGDGLLFGRDRRRGATAEFELVLWDGRGSDADRVRGLRDTFMRAWRADSVRSVPGAIAELVAPSGRRLFGRPRSALSSDFLLYRGKLKVAALFQAGDACWYGPLGSASVPFAQQPAGGARFPVRFPFRFAGSGVGQQVAVVGGDLATPLTVGFRGPIVNPRLEIGDLLVELSGAVAFDETITVDSRTRTVTSSLGGSRAGMLTARSTLLSQLSLPPGQHALVLRGQSESGTASAVVSWRDAFASY